MVGLTHNECCFIHQASDVAPNSPDLNPVDCAVWDALQQQIYHNRKFTNVDHLKQAIVEEWNKLLQCFIDRSIDEWHRRLTNVVQQQGGHTEHIYTV